MMLPVSELHDFPGHPFQVRDDEEMEKLAESITQHGVLMPGLVRPRAAGGYEIVAGHRRKFASMKAGIREMPVIVREMDDDTAVILMMTTVNWGMSAVAAQYTSDGTALISSLRTVGGAMGTAVFVAVMSAAGGPQGEALLHGLQAAFAGVSMLSALLVILAIVCVGKEERPKNFDCNKEKHHAG